jgi:hypothetical protein
MLKQIVLVVFLFSKAAFGQATFEESKAASIVVGKWFTKALAHYDFLSATPIALKRDDYRFYIFEASHFQLASDYGYSYSQVPVPADVKSAYETLGFSTGGMSSKVELNRFHANWGITNAHDLTFNYQWSYGGISGWGLGYKYLIMARRHFFLSHRLSYAKAYRDNYFDSTTVTNDLSLSLYMRLIDVYVGARHHFGKIKFTPSLNYLELPEVSYFSTLGELEYFYGVVIAGSYNSRLAIQASQIGNDTSISAKLSFHFDSLFPKKILFFQNWKNFSLW